MKLKSINITKRVDTTIELLLSIEIFPDTIIVKPLKTVMQFRIREE